MKIGRHEVRVVSKGFSTLPFCHRNPVAVIEFDGKMYEAFKQAMIGIWAFSKYPTLTQAEASEFNAMLDKLAGEV